MHSDLSDRTIAENFLSFGGGIVTVDALIRWLDRVGLGHRNAAKIAEGVNQIQAERKPAPLPSPEETAFLANQQEGYGDAPGMERQLAAFLMAD
jgi:hypothetical protein